MISIALLFLLSQTSHSSSGDAAQGGLPPPRQFTVHGFRSPSIGLEIRQGVLGFHVGLFPLIVDASDTGDSRTTWFVKTGVTAYFLRFDLGSGRPSSVFASLSLLQGLNNAWAVNRSVRQGTGVHGELGVLWAAWRGLDVRLGVGVLVGFDGRVNVHPTPGISWSTVF